MFFSYATLNQSDLDNYSQHFDEEVNLLSANSLYGTITDEVFSLTHNIPYPPSILLHPTTESTRYALGLLLTDRQENFQRAKKILNAVLALQVTDPKNPDFGRFNRYLESNLENTKISYHDNFLYIAVYLIQILLYSKEHLSKNLRKRIEDAVHSAMFFAFNSEQHIRYVGSLHYLYYIAAFTFYGSTFNIKEYINIAENNLRQYYDTTFFNGSFWEHNVPSDIRETALLLGFIKSHTTNDDCLNMIDRLNDLLWKTIAINFHGPIKTLTGPTSNTAGEMTDKYFLDFINICTGKKSTAFPQEMADVFLKCPAPYRIMINNPTPNHFIRTQVSKGSNTYFFTIAHIASNYLCKEYAIGSFNREELWRIHAPVKGYIKSYENDTPYIIKLRVLNNNYDFASAELHSIQEQGLVLGHIFLNTNRGNLHQAVDITNGKIITSDFRIRFEITGNIDYLNIASTDKMLTVSYRSTTLTYTIPYAEFSDIPVKFSFERTDSHYYFDTVLDIPENYEFNFCNLEKAIYQFTLLISSTGRKMENIENTIKDGYLITETTHNSHRLRLETPHKPNTFEYSNTYSKEFINDITLQHYVSLNEQKSSQYEFISNSIVTDNPLNIDYGNFFSELNKISRLPMELLAGHINTMLEDMLKNNYNSEIFKRYSIHIIAEVFERFESEDIQMKKIIDLDYFDIYQKISTSSESSKTAHIIMKTVNNLENDFRIVYAKISNNASIKNVIAIIENEYSNPNLSLSYIAERLGMNASCISRDFKNKTNTKYIEYLTNVRMEKAKELLIKGVPIEQVIERCGYFNVSSFKRSFKKHTKMTISAFIAQNTSKKY